MAGEVGLRRFPEAAETRAWVRDIAPDYAPPEYSQRVENALRDREWQPPRHYSDWTGRHCCHHSDSNFWFWMWALSSHRHEVHYYQPMPVQVGYWGGGGHFGESRTSYGSSSSQRGEMSAGERTAAAVGGAVALAVGIKACEYFSAREEKQRVLFQQTQQLKATWRAIGVGEISSAQERSLHAMLIRVIDAQEEVESTRVNREAAYKWSSVVVMGAGVGLIAGALINSSVIVVAGLVALAAAGTFMLMIWIISCYKDDTAPAKAVYEDYRKVATHFLASTIQQAPPSYSEADPAAAGEANRRQEAAQRWATGAGYRVASDSQVPLPETFAEFDDRMQELARGDWTGITVRDAVLRQSDFQASFFFTEADSRRLALSFAPPPGGAETYD